MVRLREGEVFSQNFTLPTGTRQDKPETANFVQTPIFIDKLLLFHIRLLSRLLAILPHFYHQGQANNQRQHGQAMFDK